MGAPVEPSTHTPGLIGGRYALQAELGSGATARVFAAQDTWLGARERALKILATSDPLLAARMRKEAALLLSLRHPHVMVAHELLSGARPREATPSPVGTPLPERGLVLVLERLRGMTADRLAEPLEPSTAAAVGAQLAAALAYLHACGLRHGDLSPANVHLRRDGATHATLIDFGFSARATELPATGTPAYAAPETLAGSAGTPGDVYALAATLHALLGMRREPSQFGRTIEDSPLGPALAAMTHPDPARRADAATAFELLLAHVAPGETNDTLVSLRDTPLTRAPLVASPQRDAQIDAWLASAMTTSSTLRIVGRAGAGKTASLRHAHGRALAHGLDAPGGVFPGEAGSLEPLARLLRSLGAVVPDLTRATHDDANGQWRSFAALAESLTALTRVAPIALCVDDVPAGSPVDELAQFLERLGNKGPRLALALSSHEASPEVPALELAPLEEDAVTTLLGRLRPLRPQDRGVAGDLRAATGGAPGVIVALSAALPGDSLLEAARRHELDSTAAADRLVAHRLAAAPARARELAGAVAWLGHTVNPARLRCLGAGDDQDDTALLDDLCARGLLRWTHAIGHASLQVAAEALRPALRRCVQPATLRALALGWHGTDHDHDADVAEIWLALGERARARPLLEAAARRALAELRTRDALTLWQGARSLVTDGSIEARRIELELGDTHLARGELEEARAAFERAHPLPTSRIQLARTLIQLGRHRAAAERLQRPDAPADEPKAEVESVEARALLLAGEREGAVAAVAAALAREPAHPRLAELRGIEGLVASYAGDHARARALLEQAVQLAAATTTPGAVDSARANLALALHRAGDLAGAGRLYLETLQAAKERHDLARQLLRVTNLATLRQEQGDSEAALRSYREAHELARLTHNELARTRIELNLANQLAWLGERNEARTLAASAATTAERLGLTTELAYLHMLEAELDIGETRTTAARALLASARRAFATSGNRAGELECDVLDAAAAAREGAADEARRLATQVSEAARGLGRARLAARASLYGSLGCLSANGDEAANAALALARSGLADAERTVDADLLWQLRALEVRHLERLGRGAEAERARERGREALVRARGATPARYERGYESVWHRAQLLGSLAGDTPRAAGPLSRDVERLLAINRELARDHDSERLLERIIDAAIALSGAERGFIILVEHSPDERATPGELVIRAARNIDPESAAQLDLGISRSIAQQAMKNGLPVVTIDALGDERFRAYASVHELKLRSVLCLPLRGEAGPLGALYLDNRYRVSAFGDADVALLSAFGDQAAMALAHARQVEALKNGQAELERMRTQLEELNARLATELAVQTDELDHARQRAGANTSASAPIRHGIVGKSRGMLEVFRVIDRVSDKEVPVTILGESGTGKELVARALHGASGKRSGPFVAVNCGAIPGPLLESELFGHERGAFTGAVRAKPGLFEVAVNGTLFLDEVGELPLAMQVKLLRVLQQREFRRVGGTTDIRTNARVVSATNRDLEAMVRAGTFREDLWYRLNVVELRLPPLRERKDDLPLLVEHLLAQRGGEQVPKLTRAALAAVLDYDWPGNVRELDNELQRGIALADRGVIDVDVLSSKVAPAGRGAGAAIAPPHATPLKDQVDEFEVAVIRDSLERHGGRVSAAAAELGLTRAGLYKKINKHALFGDSGRTDVDDC